MRIDGRRNLDSLPKLHDLNHPHDLGWHRIGNEVHAFVHALYGDEPDEHEQYENTLWNTDHYQLTMHRLWLQFTEWRIDPSKALFECGANVGGGPED